MEPQKETGNCKELFAQLSEYLDFELPPEACAQLEAHLAGCPPCIEFAESLRATVALCRRYRTVEMPQVISRHAREQLLDKWRKARLGMQGG